MTKVIRKRDKEDDFDQKFSSLSTQRLQGTSHFSEKNTSRTFSFCPKASAKTPRVHRKVDFPEYPLSQSKKLQTESYVVRTQQNIIFPQKPKQSYFLYENSASQAHSDQTDSTEVETEIEVTMPPPVLLNQGIQVDPLLTKEKLMMEMTLVGESKGTKRKKHTITTLPYEYIDIGIRKDADKSEELEKIYYETFLKDGTFKKRRFSGLYLNGEQSIGSTEISPISCEKRLKYYNYNTSKKFESSCKKTEKHVVDKDEVVTKEDIDKKLILKPISQLDLDPMEIVAQKDYVFIENVSIQPTRKLVISDPVHQISLV